MSHRYRYEREEQKRYDDAGRWIETITLFVIYDRHEEIGWMHDPAVAGQVVDLLNAAEAKPPVPFKDPRFEQFLDRMEKAL